MAAYFHCVYVCSMLRCITGLLYKNITEKCWVGGGMGGASKKTDLEISLVVALFVEVSF